MSVRKKIKVIVVDDHNLFREGLILLIKQFDFIEKIIGAEYGDNYLSIVKKFKPNIILIDIDMSNLNGIEATVILKEKYPDITVIALSMYSSSTDYYKMIDAGVDGFVNKDTDANELEIAFKMVIQGESYFSKIILDDIILNAQNQHNPINKGKIFTPRELDVLNEISKGYSNTKISEKLFISVRTIERHKENMFKKVNCNNSISLVLYAINNGIINITNINMH